MGAAFALVAVVATGGTAAVPLALSAIARAGMTSAAVNVIKQMGKSWLIKTGVPEETAENITNILASANNINDWKY